ncbi:MAG TPA: sigma 54-interacting transcriptional regulator [Kofleriaceae bacterium]|nr:sigma 54-interacting transcriptional regulator [Kofleriaceae bacterium]
MDRGGRGIRDVDPGLELVVVAGEAVTVTRLPAHGSVTLGRGEECEVRIDSPSVSRRHAVLHIGPRLRIEDLGSANGTFVRDGQMATDTTSTYRLRKLSKEIFEVVVGERVSLGGLIPIVIRRAANADDEAVSVDHATVHDPAMRALYAQVAQAAKSTSSVLILGETGVGKEVVARFLHNRSPRAAAPFLELNCAALPASLLESELFGHEKNAFTGATQARPGLLESADGGTIFLDEVGELPLPVQVKLLRVLEDHKVLRIGGREPRRLDVRFVAATHRDLEAEVGKGTFREDLYFRLNVVAFVIPPLRQRVTEIAPLARRFLAAELKKYDRVNDLQLSTEALSWLERYPWRGNVRELRNVIERAVVLSRGNAILPADLPERITSAAQRPEAPLVAQLSTSAEEDKAEPRTGAADRSEEAPAARMPKGSAAEPGSSPEEVERRQIIEELDRCAGNQTRAAKQLGISRRTLVTRLGKYRVPRPRTRNSG